MIGVFLAFSAEITAFTVFELQGTGLAETYLETVQSIVGQQVVTQLLDAYDSVQPTCGPKRDEALRLKIFGDEKLGPIARNILKLWYSGIWNELPHSWTDKYGALPRNTQFTVSVAAYIEGLVWTAAGTHPPGAKPPGYGSWAEPPRIP
jgi:hypothetical protein